MKKHYAIVFFIMCLLQMQAQTALFNNLGADVHLMPGAFMIVKADSLHNHAGSIENGGNLVVEGNIYNDATLAGRSASPTGLYRIQGDWINNGITTPFADSVELYGGNQLITGTQPSVFHHLILSGTPGSVKAQTIDASVDGNLNLNDHELATDINEMLVLNTATGAIQKAAGPAGFVSSMGPGRLTRATAATTPYFYPLGTPSALTGAVFYYRPLEITPVAATSNRYGARLAHNPLADSFDPDLMNDELCKVNPLFYHNIYHQSGNANASIKMFFDGANDGKWTDIGHWKAAVWNYMPTASVSANGSFSTVEVKNWGDFNPVPFALAAKKITVDAGPDKEIYPGETTSLDPVINFPATNIQWMPSYYLDFDNIASPKSTPVENIEYTIFVKNDVGCIATDKMKISVLPENLLVPTGFTPNGDGNNDVFRPANKNLDKIVFQVFNRWGEKVFETENAEEGWDGAFRGVKQDMGVYVWKAEYKLNGATATKFASGNVTLVR
ncbi:MAG: gliding motility-associated C-terminal domain-containing protein [Chitinophagales bacterium]